MAAEEIIHTVVIGGGQAGLAMSYYLSRHTIPHVVLERARVGERWRSERWDSLRFQFPNEFARLPGFPYDGTEPHAFMHRDEVVARLETYANRIAAPLRTGVDVLSLTPTADGAFELGTTMGRVQARHVVVATGPYQVPRIPDFARHLATDIRQLPASRYSSARDLPAGGVLVVGAGGSGCQIAEDLVTQGRDTYLAVSPHRRLPRRYAGRDITFWLEEMGLLDRTAAQLPSASNAPLLTGVDGGYEVSLDALADKGAHLVGRVLHASGWTLEVSDSVRHDVTAGDQSLVYMQALIDAFREGRALPEPEPTEMPQFPRYSIDLKRAGITSIVWATGYNVDFSWIKSDVFTASGRPRHERGISAVRGLMFLGLPLLHKVRSSFLWGVGEDAQHLAEHIALADASDP